MHSTVRALSLVSVASILNACGGGTPSKSALPTRQPATATVVFKIVVRGPSAHARHPLFVPSNPSAVTITVTPSSGHALPPITAALSVGENDIPVTAPLGSDTFAVTLSDSHGNALARGVTQPFNVLNDAANVVPIVLDGVPASLAITIGGTLTTGTPGAATVTVNAYDALQPTPDLILSPGNYASPITLQDSDTSATTLVDTPPVGSGRAVQTGSSVIVISASDVVTMTYTGGAVSGAHLTATVPAIPSVPMATAAFSSVGGSTHILYALISASANSANVAQYSLPSGTPTGSPVAVTFLDAASQLAPSLAIDGNGRAYVGLIDVVFPVTACTEDCLEQIATNGTASYAHGVGLVSSVNGVTVIPSGQGVLADSQGLKGTSAIGTLTGPMTNLNTWNSPPTLGSTVAFDTTGAAYAVTTNSQCTGDYPVQIDKYLNNVGQYSNTPTTSYTTACPAIGSITLPPNQPPSMAIAADATGAYLAGASSVTPGAIEIYSTATQTISATVTTGCATYSGVAFDASDNLYVASPACSAIYKIASGATTSSIFLSGITAKALFIK